MKQKLIALILGPVFLFASCEHLTPEQKTAIASYGSTVGSQILNAAAQYGIAYLGSKVPTGSPYASSAAVGLRALQNTEIVTASDIQTAIVSFGDPSNTTKWSNFGGQVANILTRDGTQAVTSATLEAAATALNQLNTAKAKLPPAP